MPATFEQDGEDQYFALVLGDISVAQLWVDINRMWIDVNQISVVDINPQLIDINSQLFKRTVTKNKGEISCMVWKSHPAERRGWWLKPAPFVSLDLWSFTGQRNVHCARTTANPRTA